MRYWKMNLLYAMKTALKDFYYKMFAVQKIGSLFIMYSRFVNFVQNLINITSEMVGSGCSKPNKKIKNKKS
jgi:hypothetical protein